MPTQFGTPTSLPILQGRRTAVDEKTPWAKKRLVCAPGIWPSTCPDPFLDRNRSLTISTAIVRSRYLVELAAAYIHTNPDSVNRIWRGVPTFGKLTSSGISQLITCFGVGHTDTHAHAHAPRLLFQKALPSFFLVIIVSPFAHFISSRASFPSSPLPTVLCVCGTHTAPSQENKRHQTYLVTHSYARTQGP